MGHAAMTDLELFEASSAGQIEAFTALVERYQSLVCAVSYSATGDQALSEDVAQDTFVAAWRGLNELREPSKFRAWLCGIARNLSRNALRRVGREVPGDVEVQAALHGIESTSQSPLDDALEKESEQLVWAALACIPETYREPLVLFYREDKSTKQVAEVLGLSENAVQQRLSRGRQHLKQGVSGLVESTLERTKPSKEFAAGVLVTISTGPLASTTEAASASTSATAQSGTLLGLTGALTMKKISIISVLAAIALLTVFSGYAIFASVNQPSPSNASSATAVKPRGAHAPERSGLSSVPPHEGASRQAATSVESAEDHPTLPAYELTVAAPTLVAVNLSGGASSVTTFREPDPPLDFTRHVRGYVSTWDGKPARGAVVLVGKRIRQQWGSLIGEQGAITDELGAFDVAVHSAETRYAMAIHHVVGWSSTQIIPAGDGDLAVELTIAPPGSLFGAITRGNEPERAALTLTSVDDTISLSLTSENDGTFRYPLLPPGTYRLRAALAQEVAGGASKALDFDIVVKPNESTEQNIELPVGLLLAVHVISPKTMHASMIEYTLVHGEHAPATDAALKELVATPVGANHRYMLFGGSHKEHVMQFYDLAPGTVTVCVTLRKSKQKAIGFECKKLALDASVDVQEITLDFNR